jgi:WD40 repeat protein
MTRAILALTIALVAGSCVAPTVTPSAAPSATASPSPTATRQLSKSVRATAVTSIPQDFRYIDASPGRDVTLWLVDLRGGVPPAAIAQWTLGNQTFSASRDGKTVIIAAPGERSIVALHLLRPLTGEATVLFEGPTDGRILYPRLSPDGTRFAFTLGRNTSTDGVWIGDVATGVARQLFPPDAPLANPTPVYGWSDDSQWLSYGAYDPTDIGKGFRLYLHNVVDGRRVDAGPAYLQSWRAREPRLLTLTQRNDNTGAVVASFDLAQGKRVEQLSTVLRVTALTWHPSGDTFLYVGGTKQCNFVGTVWTRSLGATESRQVGNLATAQDAWWSADGNVIYALVSAPSGAAVVVNAQTGQLIATIPGAGPTFAC